MYSIARRPLQLCTLAKFISQESGAAIQAISKWDVATKIPIGEEVSFADLAKRCEVHETDMQRVLRYGMTFHRLFCEPRRGYVAHSLASRLLAEEPLLRQGLWQLGEEALSWSQNVVEAIHRFKGGQEPNQTGFQLAHGTDLAAYEYMEKNPDLARRFALSMSSFASFPNRPTTSATEMTISGAFDLSSLGSGLVVDVGGSQGTDAINIATQCPGLRVVVQDLPKAFLGAEARLPEELRTSGRVSFMPYDFFTPQTVCADAYLIKQCLHNWPDHYCINILKNQIPALRPGARLIIIDSVAPLPGQMSLMDERTVR